MTKPAKIQLLPPEIIHRIAAGEVVDKPASILKELVENSIDAGASRVEVTLADGGLRSIQVDDNGWGLSFEDLSSCVQRHATSKISRIEDLDAIPLLGFRGEALSAAASVSRLTIDTFREGSGAWSLRVVGGDREKIKPGARRSGTRVLLEDLFFNVPARRKFLRKPGLELQECLDALESLSLAHPEVELAWAAVDEKGEVRAQKRLAAGTLAERFAAVAQVKGELVTLEIDSPATGVKRLNIVFFKPPAAGKAMKSVRLTVNGRPVLDKRLPYIVRESFVGLMEVGRFPFAHIAVQVDPSLIDVNIHPQKKEIRWSSGFNLGGLVYAFIKDALTVPKPVTPESASPAAPEPNALDFGAPLELGSLLAPLMAPPVIRESTAYEAPTFRPLSPLPPLSSPTTAKPSFKFSELKVLGEALAAWIVCEAPQGVILIDQHAAHERVNFEKQFKRLDLIRAKPLFIPIRFTIPYVMKGSEPELKSALERVGFEFADVETLPANEWEIIAVPESERRVNWDELIESMVTELQGDVVIDRVVERLKVKVAASLACHGSVRRGQRLGIDEIKQLLRDLDAIEWGGLCPHGRPVWFLLSNSQIENLFHR